MTMLVEDVVSTEIPPPVEARYQESIYAMWHDPSTYDHLKHGPPYLPEPKVKMASTDPRTVKNEVRPLVQKMAADEMTEIAAILEHIKSDFGPTPMSELAGLLAFLRAEAVVHQAHHWQTRGDYGDHLLYERIYGEVYGNIDPVAERMIGTGHHILAHPTLLEKHCSLVVQSFYRDAGANPPSDAFPVLSLRAVLRTMVALKVVYSALEQQGKLSLGIDNLLQGISDEHEGHVYLLKQRAQSRTASKVVQGMRLPGVEIEGLKYKWQQAKKETGRAAIGAPQQQLRPWRLVDSGGNLIAQLLHTHFIPPYATPHEDPAWKVHVRVNGKDFTLKGRWADPDRKGDENTTALHAAAEAAVKAYQNLKQSQVKTASYDRRNGS